MLANAKLAGQDGIFSAGLADRGTGGLTCGSAHPGDGMVGGGLGSTADG